MEIGAATRVRRREPTKRPGKLDKPREIAPSSRRGKITKYALRICKHMNCSQSDREREGVERRGEEERRCAYEEEAGGGADEGGDLVRVDGDDGGDDGFDSRSQGHCEGAREKKRGRRAGIRIALLCPQKMEINYIINCIDYSNSFPANNIFTCK